MLKTVAIVETHGKEPIKVDLFCDLELRLQNLIEK